jgi:hypothetical protein
MTASRAQEVVKPLMMPDTVSIPLSHDPNNFAVRPSWALT